MSTGARLFTALVLIAGCKGEDFKEPQTLGGVSIAPETLNQGRRVYVRLCAGCHGPDGKGTTTARTAAVPPRDLTLGRYKFLSPPASGVGLPTDEDLARSIRFGFDGTQMAPIAGTSDEEVMAVAHYVKTFSSRWRELRPDPPVAMPADPWTHGTDAPGREAAITRGYRVYHGVAQCWACHPGYASADALNVMVQQAVVESGETPLKKVPQRADLGASAPVETAFGKVLPPDFLGDKVRAAKTPEDFFRAVAAGIGGTPMPAWHDRLSARDLWAVVHYVRELVRMRGTPRAQAWRLGIPASPSTQGSRSTNGTTVGVSDRARD